MAERVVRKGGCHCGRVRFEVTTDLARIMACNCSICAKQGLWLTFVPAQDFKLVSGDDALKDYQFAKKQVHHMFCRECGVECFGKGSAPGGESMVALNVRCLDDIDIATLDPMPFDGKTL